MVEMHVNCSKNLKHQKGHTRDINLLIDQFLQGDTNSIQELTFPLYIQRSYISKLLKLVNKQEARQMSRDLQFVPWPSSSAITYIE